MCGIAGYIRTELEAASTEAVLRMTRELRHRGPDDEGLTLLNRASGDFVNLATDRTAPGVPSMRRAEGGPALPHDVAFGQCRFSIVDLSAGGHQPFWSSAGDVCVTFNGEIYNHVELRRELEDLGHAFRTETDTEVLVEAYRAWGTDCFSRFVGFWAIGLYDARRRAVLLGRDRIGKAPLYIARQGGAVWFASEIPAILAATGRNIFPVREQAVADFMAHAYRDVHHRTFYEGIESFPSAAFAWVRPDGSFDPQTYWRLPPTRLSERQFPARDAVEAFRSTLADAIAIRTRADVPVGFELSGGLDSSCLVAAAASRGHRVKAYTVSFPGTSSDEEPYARMVRDRYPGLIDYTVLTPPEDDFWEQADEYVGRIAEPFHAPNTVTNRGIWRRMAEQGIRVSINGAAGDESWGGYFNDYYQPFLRDAARRGRWGQLLRSARLFGDPPHAVWSKTFLQRVGGAFSDDEADLNGAYMTSSFGSRPHPVPTELVPLRLAKSPGVGPAADLEQRLRDHMGPWRMNYWLRHGNASYMSVPTELRCPFLDHRLVELAFTVPLTYLIRDGWLKWLPRQAMARDLPAGVVWRKRKMGFPFPYEQWALRSKSHFLRLIDGLDCPYVDGPKLTGAYDALARSNPLFLWRLMSLTLWWKKCVMGEVIA